MSEKTEKLELNTFLETDVFDFEKINENFSIIDDLPLPYETGTMTSTYQYEDYNGDSRSGNATWRYKRYTNKEIELTTKISLILLGISKGSSAPYYSNDVTVLKPLRFSEIYRVTVDVATDGTNNSSSYRSRGWSSVDYTSYNVPAAFSNNGNVVFRILGDNSISWNTNQTIIIELKGVEP